MTQLADDVRAMLETCVDGPTLDGMHKAREILADPERAEPVMLVLSFLGSFQVKHLGVSAEVLAEHMATLGEYPT